MTRKSRFKLKKNNKQTNFPQRLRVKVLPLQRAYEAAR